MGVPPPGEIAPGHWVGVGHLIQPAHHPFGCVPILELPVEQPCQEEEGLGALRGGLDRRIEGPDHRDVPGHGAENVHRLIVETDVDAGLGVHDVELDGMAVLGRIGHRQPLHPQLLPECLEERAGRRRLSGGEGELGENLTQIVVIRRAAECFVQRMHRLPHLVRGGPLQPGPVVEEKGVLLSPFLVMGTVGEEVVELHDRIVWLPVRLVFVGPARMPLGIPLNLPPVEEVHPDGGGHNAGHDAKKKSMVDALHGRVSSREMVDRNLRQPGPPHSAGGRQRCNPPSHPIDPTGWIPPLGPPFPYGRQYPSASIPSSGIAVVARSRRASSSKTLREPKPMTVTIKWRLRGGRGNVRAAGWPGQRPSPRDGDSRRPRPPGAIIADPDGNRIGIHSMA